MTAQLCIVDGRRPVEDALVCSGCTERAAGHLAEIARLTPDARAVAYGLSGRRGESGGSRKPGSRSPGDDDAMDSLDVVQGELGTLVRMVEEERGAETVHKALGDRVVPDPLVWACEALRAQLGWLRGHAAADEALDVVERCVRRMRSLVDGPAPKRYLGPCGAWRDHDAVCGCEGAPGCQVPETCEGDVYGVPGGEKGSCRTCGAQVAQDERRAWLDEQASASDLVWTALGIADALGLSVKTIRSWATERLSDTGTVLREAKLSTYWRSGGRLVPWVRPREGENVRARGDRLHYVADVLELARAAAIRRAENEARRERRETAEMGA